MPKRIFRYKRYEAMVAWILRNYRSSPLNSMEAACLLNAAQNLQNAVTCAKFELLKSSRSQVRNCVEECPECGGDLDLGDPNAGPVCLDCGWSTTAEKKEEAVEAANKALVFGEPGELDNA